MKRLTLIIEKTDGEFVGRVNFQDDLLVDSASDLPTLESKIGRLLKKFHNVKLDEIKFQYRYDLSALFETFDFLKISNIAEIAGVNPSLLRQYVNGNKQASSSQAKKIEATIHKLGKKLTEVELYGIN